MVQAAHKPSDVPESAQQSSLSRLVRAVASLMPEHFPGHIERPSCAPSPHPRKQVPPHSKENDLANQTFPAANWKNTMRTIASTRQKHTASVRNVSPTARSWTPTTANITLYATMYPTSQARYAFTRMTTQKCILLQCWTYGLDTALKKTRQKPTNITPEHLTPDQRNTYIRMLEDALRKLQVGASPNDLGGGEIKEE